MEIILKNHSDIINTFITVDTNKNYKRYILRTNSDHTIYLEEV